MEELKKKKSKLRKVEMVTYKEKVIGETAYTKMLSTDKDKDNADKRIGFNKIVKFQEWMEKIGNIYLFDHKQMNEAYNVVINNK